MLGLLARVVIGVVAAGVVGGTAYGVYKLITKDSAKSELNEKIQGEDRFKEAFKAKFKQKKDETFTFTMMDEWDEPLGDVDLEGDEISSDIESGVEIILKDEC